MQRPRDPFVHIVHLLLKMEYFLQINQTAAFPKTIYITIVYCYHNSRGGVRPTALLSEKQEAGDTVDFHAPKLPMSCGEAAGILYKEKLGQGEPVFPCS